MVLNWVGKGSALCLNEQSFFALFFPSEACYLPANQTDREVRKKNLEKSSKLYFSLQTETGIYF